jgi:hypothetical protein
MATKDNRKSGGAGKGKASTTVRLAGYTENFREDNYVDLAPRLRARFSEELRLEDKDLGVEAIAILAYEDRTGRYEVQDLTIKRMPWAPRMNVVLRRLNLPTLIEQYGASFLDRWVESEVAPNEWERGMATRFGDESEEAFVARVYRFAMLCGQKPTQGVAEVLDITPAAASQKVWLARKLGFLPKTEPGKAKA